nr:protein DETOXIFICATION 46, chloroplastic-like [Ipomoea batatas]
MYLGARTFHCSFPVQNGIPRLKRSVLIDCPLNCSRGSPTPLPTRFRARQTRLITACISHSRDILHEDVNESEKSTQSVESSQSTVSVSGMGEEEAEKGMQIGETLKSIESKTDIQEFSADESIWSQIVEIVKFSGPAVGLWLCGPLMSLIDTAVIGQGSSIELAALGPGTVFCDNTSYLFMFLSIATSNLVATALARQDKSEVQHQISTLLFIALTCGVLMLFFTILFGPWGLTAFTGARNAEIITAANTYVQIRGLAWPAILVGLVTQSASLGMKDSWGPLKALAAASVINGVGDIVLCRFFNYGIAGAAWATMVSQVVAAYMMIEALNQKGYNGFAVSIPSYKELQQIFVLAGPVFITMMSKVAFYSLLVYCITSMGTHVLAGHQVMIQLFCLCAVWSEPLSQTAQSFMPELIYGVNRNLSKAQMLLKSLLIIAAINGFLLACIGTSIPWLFPKIFSPDPPVIREMQSVLIPYFLALCVSPSVHSLEGTLLAGRDLKFISASMSGLFGLVSLLLLLLSRKGFGLAGCWFTLVAFQWSRYAVALRRLTSPNGMLYSEDSTYYEVDKLKAV